MIALSAPVPFKSRRSLRRSNLVGATVVNLHAPLRNASDRRAPSILAQLGWQAGLRVALARLWVASRGGSCAGSFSTGEGFLTYNFRLRFAAGAGRRLHARLLLFLLAFGACSRSPTELSGPEMSLKTELGTFRVVAAQCAPDFAQLHGGLDVDAHSGPLTAQSCMQIAVQECHLPAATFAGALVGYRIVLGNGGSWIDGNELRINCDQQQAAIRHEACHALRRQFSCLSDPDRW